MDIGQRIREVREELGMPVTVLARRAGAAPATIYRIESGNRTPSMALLEKIAKELRVPPSALMQEPSPLGDAPLLEGLPVERMYLASPAQRRKALELATDEARRDYVATLERVIIDVLASLVKPGDWADVATDESKSKGERRVAREQLARIWKHLNRLATLRTEIVGEDEQSREELAGFIATRVSAGERQ